MKLSTRAVRTCSLLVVILMGFGAGAANADRNPPTAPAGSSPIDLYMQTKGSGFLTDQKQLSEFKLWITELPGIEQAGYVGQVNDATTRSTRVLWKGASPLRDTVRAGGQARGISVTFSERPYSLPEIRATIARIDSQKKALSNLGFQVDNIAGVRDDDGTIAVEGRAAPGAAPDWVMVAAAANQAAGTPVRVVNTVRATPATRSRDSSPFNSGAYMMTSNYHVCSTGFALASSTQTYTITARHCDAGPWYDRDDSTKFIGSEFWDSSTGQSSLIAGAGSKWMYDGTWDNSWGLSKATSGVRDVSIGDWICTSGGNSGVHCNIQVRSEWNWWDDGFGGAYNTEGLQIGGTDIAAIQGDSGGPVLMPYSDGTVGAVGMIQAVINGHADGCGSVHDYGPPTDPNLCSADFFFTPERTIANSYGLSLVTW
ncbi:hypothetical protein [Arthrobacter sp. UYEF3]|uniref:hypothetical protein n=1 Tax=Arthrobacter sp. UYEF3 TaxID=1756365 RepID=UPI003397B91B